MIDTVWYDYSDLSTDYLSVMLWLLIIRPGDSTPDTPYLDRPKGYFQKSLVQMLPYAGGRGASGGSVLASWIQSCAGKRPGCRSFQASRSSAATNTEPVPTR